MSYDQELEERKETARELTQDEVEQQADDNQPDEPKRLISNFWVDYYLDDNGKRKMVKYGKPASAIWSDLCDAIGPVVRRVGPRLFVLQDDRIKYLMKTDDFFGWCPTQGITFDWGSGSDMLPKSEFFAYISNAADNYDFASVLPHFPPVANFHYVNHFEPKETGRLKELVSFFNPATDHDRDLITAAICTPFWGQHFGQRPAFLIDGVEGSEESKRGIGKSTLTEVLDRLCGGLIDLSSKGDGEEMKKRLLTAGDMRLIRFDNIKTNNLSHEALESFITAGKISGHLMYKGQCSIPNLFGYYLTFNDASMSKDMAQRCVVIRLKRPTYEPYWLTNLNNLIDTYRNEIIQDIGHTLTTSVDTIEAKTRFPLWEMHVLSKCTKDLAGLQATIKREQSVVDDEDLMKEEIRDLIFEKLCNLLKNIDPSKTTLGINRRVIIDWCVELFPKGASRRSVSKNFERCRPYAFLPNSKTYLGAQYLIWSHSRYEASLGGSNSPHEPSSCHRIEIDGLNHRTFEWNFKKVTHQSPDESPSNSPEF